MTANLTDGDGDGGSRVTCNYPVTSLGNALYILFMAAPHCVERHRDTVTVTPSRDGCSEGIRYFSCCTVNNIMTSTHVYLSVMCLSVFLSVRVCI